MIAFIAGKLVQKKPTLAVIDTGGVGYELIISLATYEALPAEGETARLLTYLHVREDIQRLYGFFTDEERNLFKLVISISGIGPNLGLSILSGSTVQDFKQAIRTENVAAISAIPGIGKKTAQRMVVELKEKIGTIGAGKAAAGATVTGSGNAIVDDAMAALMSLGLKPPAAQAAIDNVYKAEDKELTLQQLIRKALQNL